MQKNKTQIIIIGALAVTILMSFRSVLMLLVAQDKFTALLGLSIEALILRVIILFTYAYLLLGFNIIWKDKWKKSRFVSFTTNLGLFISTVILTTRSTVYFSNTPLDDGQIFMITVTNFLIVHPILMLLASFINLSFQQQQNILEKEQAKQKALQHQLEALRAQINPHFLFNALNSLTVLIRTKSERALPFVDQLSWLLRTTLLRKDEDFITIQNELEYLESYIFLQKERFGKKFNVAIQVPENWKKELIPSFSLQLLAENAIKHNIVSTNQPLLLEIYPNGTYLIIRNQIHKRRDVTEGAGLGLVNLSVRFKLLKKRDIQIKQDENYFIVKLPILKNESHNN